jgi:hypothetical protein
MTRLAPLALVVPFALAPLFPGEALANPLNRPLLLLHVGAVTGKNPCGAAPTTCDGVVTTGAVDPVNGAGQFLYVLARNAGPEGAKTLAGVQFGIDYDAPGPGEGVVVNSWTLCATLQFPMPTPVWPSPGSGNLVTWDSVTRCQTGELAVVGFFYVTAYSPAVFRLTPRPVDARAKVGSCAAAEYGVYPDHLGWVSFGGAARDGDEDGWNPCSEATLPANPVAVFTRPPDGFVTSQRSISPVFSGLDDVTPMEELEFWVRLDGGAWSPAYRSGDTPVYSFIANGAHTLELRVRDEDGNLTEPADVVTFTVASAANLPPNVTITGGPAEGSSFGGTAFSFTWSIEDEVEDLHLAQSSWRFDGGPWSAWSTSEMKLFTGVAVGDHVFEVRVRDAYGVEDLTPAIRSFTTVSRAGNLAPVTTVTNPPADGDTVVGETKLVTWQIADDRSSELGFIQSSWRLDGGTWSEWGGAEQVDLTGLATGPHLFEVRARDLDGAVEAPPAARQFVVVTNGPPDTFFTMGLADGDTVYSYFLWLGFSGTDDGTPVSGLTYSIRRLPNDFGPAFPRTGLWIAPDVGWQTYEARARDQWGLFDPTPASITLYFDRREPESEIISGPAEGSTVQTAQFRIMGYDLVTPPEQVQLSWRLDEGPWSPWQAGQRTVQPAMPAGPHRFEVRARDGDGIVDQTPDFRNFILESDTPALPIVFADLAVDDVAGRIRLSWRVDADEPVVFHVHRAPAGAATRGDDLSGRLVPDARGAASFVDATAEPGRAYDYRIVAVGRTETVEHGPIRATAPGAALRLRVATPARAGEGVPIDLQMAGADGGRLELFDTAGRLLRVWALPAGEPGWRREQWDGRDAAGRPAPAGLYFLRLTAEGKSVTARVVRLR